MGLDFIGLTTHFMRITANLLRRVTLVHPAGLKGFPSLTFCTYYSTLGFDCQEVFENFFQIILH